MTDALMDAVRNYWAEINNRTQYPVTRRAQKMDPIINVVVHALIDRGIDPSWIQTGREARLPGSLGMGQSLWDIVVSKDETPLGAIEVKSLPGPSGAKNLRNRIDELTSRSYSVRNSDDLGEIQPQLGLFMMLEQDKSGIVQPKLTEALNQFHDDELYDEIAYTHYADEVLREPAPEMTVQRFIDRFSRRLLARAAGPLEEITPYLERYREVIESAQGAKKDYSLHRVPKRGGQAEVFTGIHKASGIEIAFKRRLSPGKKAAARMIREIEISRLLSGHPHGVPALDFDAKHEWFVMPLAQATAEDQALHLKDPQHLRTMIKAVASILAEAHRHGWRHRDVKPSNILLLHGRWTLADWGTARRPRGQTTFIGRTGAYIGTLGFAAPELSSQPHKLAVPATDIYSLGRVAAWALTGEWPQANIPLLPAQEPWLTIVSEATQHEIERRPQSIDEFLALVEREYRRSGENGHT